MTVLVESHTITLHGSDRRYIVISPEGVNPAELPVIIDLHGSGSNPDEHAAVTGATTLAAMGAFVVLPQAAIPFQLLADWPAGWAWNVPDSPLPGEATPRNVPDDIAFIDTLTSCLVDKHGVDAGRLHLRGYSGGARLSSHLIATTAHRFRSVCCVAGVRFVDCHGGSPPPIFAVHGRRDMFNPFEGGSGARWVESVPSAVERWAEAAGCTAPPHVRLVAEGVSETRHTRPDGLAAVRLIAVSSAQHAWPGTTDNDHIAQFGEPGPFSASQAHWEFIHEVEAVTP